MRLLARFIASLALVLALAAPAWAQEISAEQRAALSARIESFNAAVKGNDMAGVMTALPPKLLEKIASTYGVTTEQLLEAMQAEVATALAGVEIVSFGMDLDAAEFVAKADGTTYALIPTETVVDMGEAGGKMRASAHTLGLLDAGTWYLIRIDDPQQEAMVKELYPALADVDFPAGSSFEATE